MKKSTIGYLLTTTVLVAGCAGSTPRGNYVVEQRYVHKYGMDVPKEHWEETGKNGQVVTRLKDGVTCTQTYYNGLLEGDTSYTLPQSEELDRIETYSANQLIKKTEYYLSGRPKKQISYDSPNSFSVKQWYENGTISVSETFIDNQLDTGEYFDLKHQRTSVVNSGSGTRTQRDANGRLFATETIEHGQVKSRTLYHPNGTPKEVIPYENDIVEGPKRTFLPGGEPATIETWQNGKQQGITTLFRDGLKEEEIPYVNGIKNGVGKVYKDGTVVVQEVSWKDDERHGPTTIYSESDNSTTTEWWLKGKKVSKGLYDAFVPPPGVKQTN